MYVSSNSGNVGPDGAKGSSSPTPGRAQRAGKDQGGPETRRHREFIDLLEPLYPKALAYAQTITGSLMDGEDLVSDAVLAAYSRFDTLRSRERFKEWFFAILLNRFRNLHNRRRLRPLTLVAEPSGSRYFWEATIRVSCDPAELGYQLTLVKELLARLTPRERDTLLLLGPTGFTPSEVAHLQQKSKRAVIQCAFRARKKLAKLLPPEELARLTERMSEGQKHG